MAANTTGVWGSLFSWPLIGIHSILTQDGKVLSFGTDTSGNQGGMMYHDLWDPISGTHTTIDHSMKTPTDIFCANAIIVPGTEKILIAGGDARPLGSINKGVSDVNVFNTSTNQITPDTHGKMAYARWYATAISLADGKVLVLGGSDLTGKVITVPEIYTPGEGWKTLSGANEVNASAQYDRAFVNTDGKVVYFTYVGSKVMLLDPAGNGTLTKIGTLPFTTNWESPAIQFAPGKILVNDDGSGLWTMDINGTTPVFTKVGDLGSQRNFGNMTVLADGKVMINGGATVTNVDSAAVKTVMIWDPATNAVTTTVSESQPRLYHSTSILLTDGTVLSMGGGSFASPSPTQANQQNGQIYKPGYLFDAAGNAAKRPVILETPDHMQSGTTFTITVDNAADIAKLTFVKAGATTHDFNMNSGFATLAFTVGANNTLVVTLPDYHQGVTAGSWMLFAWNKAGVPSIAPVLEVDPVFSTGAVVDPANMLTNGSFETAATVSSYKILDDIVGWHSTKNNFEIWKSGNSGVAAKDGATVVEVDAERGALWQSVHTKAGQSYDLTFDFSGRPGFVSSSRMEVLWNGAVIATITPVDATFKAYTFKVTGTGGNDQLAFRSLASDTDTVGGLLDHVVLKPGTVAPPPTNLLVNGDIEAIKVTDAAGYHFYTNAEMSGWQNAGADSIAVVNHMGSQMLDLDPEGAADELFQLVRTKAGTNYTLTFGATATAPGSSTVDVLWNGKIVATIDPSATALQNYTFTVAGTGGLDKLSFRELTAQNDFFGAYLDNVKLLEGGTIQPPPSNLIANADMEALRVTNSWGWNNFTNTQMTGWKNTGADNVVIVNYLGSQMLDLDPEGAADELYQLVQTKAAQVYTLTFDAISTKAGSSAFDVLWNGVKVAAVNPGETSVQSFTYTVTGTGNMDKLSFRELSTQNDYFGSYLDNVKLVVQAATAGAVASAAMSHEGNHVMGTSGNDMLKGTSAMDHIMGMGGNDKIVSYGGDDTIDGGAGTDTLRIAACPRELHILKNADGSYEVATATQTLTIEGIEKLALIGGAKNYGVFSVETLRTALARPVDAAHAKANLLVNGSFETIGTTLSDGAQLLHVSDTAMPGWHSSQSGFEVWHDGYQNQAGPDRHNVVEVDAVDGNISQRVSTQAGHIYRLTFDFAGQKGHLASSDMQVVWNGHVVLTVDPHDAAFHGFATAVVGSGSLDTLSFRSMAGDKDSFGGLLDHVALQDFTLAML